MVWHSIEGLPTQPLTAPALRELDHWLVEHVVGWVPEPGIAAYRTKDKACGDLVHAASVRYYSTSDMAAFELFSKLDVASMLVGSKTRPRERWSVFAAHTVAGLDFEYAVKGGTLSHCLALWTQHLRLALAVREAAKEIPCLPS